MYKIRYLYILLLTIPLCYVQSVSADTQQVIKQCESCHGSGGNSRKSDIPSIASFSVEYMKDVMADFKSGKRQGKRVKASPASAPTTMNDIAKKLSANELNAAMNYFSKQKFVAVRQPSNPVLAKRGAKVYDRRCMKCHGDNGNDPEDEAAILKGQWLPYLKSQLKEFKAGKRPMPKKMKKQLVKLKPKDEEALMHFFAQP